MVWLSSSRMSFLIPGEVRSQRCLLGPPWNVASTYRCWVIFTRPEVLTSNCCEQSQLLLMTYFPCEVDKHVMVRSVGLRSPIDGGHPKSSSHANPDAAAFYLDNASDSVADFHKYLRWYDFLGQLPLTSPGNVPDLDRVGTRSRSGTNVPNQVTNLEFCSQVNLFEVGGTFFCCFLKV